MTALLKSGRDRALEGIYRRRRGLGTGMWRARPRGELRFGRPCLWRFRVGRDVVVVGQRDRRRRAEWVDFAIDLATVFNETPPEVDPGATTVVAGRQMDLSALFSCRAPSCQIAQADRLLSRAWHYFDSIDVEGLGPRRFLRSVESGGPADVAGDVRAHALVLLHLRAIGAEPYLLFREKPHAFCADHFREHAQEIGLPAALDDEFVRSVIERLAEEVEIERWELLGVSATPIGIRDASAPCLYQGRNRKPRRRRLSTLRLVPDRLS